MWSKHTLAAVHCAVFFPFPESDKHSPSDSAPYQGHPDPTAEKTYTLINFNLSQSNILVVICHAYNYRMFIYEINHVTQGRN